MLSRSTAVSPSEQHVCHFCHPRLLSLILHRIPLVEIADNAKIVCLLIDLNPIFLSFSDCVNHGMSKCFLIPQDHILWHHGDSLQLVPSTDQTTPIA